MNPYFNQTFFGFFATLFDRLIHFFPGKLASDEIQLAVLLGVAVSTALVGNFLIWRKMAMLANSLSHTILLGIVFAFVLSGVRDAHEVPLSILLFSAVTMGLLTAFFTEFLTRGAKLQADASIGIVFTSLFALGVIFATLLTRNSHIGIEAVMGNADALTSDDIPLAYIILGINLFLFFLFFKEYKITSFDPALAKVLGISATLFNYLLMAQVSLTAIGAFRSVGVLMVLALLTAPPLIARLVTHRMMPLLCLSVLIGCVASAMGVALSRHLLTSHGIALSTAGLIVCLLLLFFILASLWNKKMKTFILLLLLPAYTFGYELQPAPANLITPRIEKIYIQALIESGLFLDEKTAAQGVEWEKTQEDPAKVHYHFLIVTDQIEYGFLSYSLLKKEAFIEAICINEEYRRQGVGETVLRKFLAELQEIDTVRLFVFAHNRHARHLYEKIGFEVETIFEHEGKEIGYHLKKTLSNNY